MSDQLDFNALHAEATERCGLNNFGGFKYEPALHALIDSINTESGMNAGGFWGQRERIINILISRARIESLLEQHPEINDEIINEPVVIVGLPRTGTTMLHRILASDSRFYTPIWFETRFPAPKPDEDFRVYDSRIDDGKAEVAGMLEANPDLASIHPMDAEAPDEEIMLLEQSFYSTMPPAFCNVPSYVTWLETHDNTPGYEYLKRLLQVLQWQKKEKGQQAQRWLLKTPHHLHHMDTLFKVFPEALVVQSHRDPLETIPSIASFNTALWKLCADRIDEKVVGELSARKYAKGMHDTMIVREQHPDAVLDVNYKETIKTPFETIEKVYQFIGMELTEEARAGMLQWQQENKREDRASHEYTLEQFGYTVDSLKSLFNEYREKFIEQEPAMEDPQKYALITGATNGIGIPTALEVARRGYHITLLARNPTKAEALKQQIFDATGNDKVDLLIADLSSLTQMRKAASDYLLSGKPLHLLINNAGVVSTQLKMSEDGYESMFAVNYMAVFLFTNQLLPRLQESGKANEKARIVNVSTEGYKMAKGIDYDNINAEKKFSTFGTYAHSKLATMLFNRELAERLKDQPVNTYTVHPGWVDTGLGHDGSFLMTKIVSIISRLFAKTPEQGAATTLFAAFDPSTENQNGEYYADSKIKPRNPQALDMDAAKKLWQWTEQELNQKKLS